MRISDWRSDVCASHLEGSIESGLPVEMKLGDRFSFLEVQVVFRSDGPEIHPVGIVPGLVFVDGHAVGRIEGFGHFYCGRETATPWFLSEKPRDGMFLKIRGPAVRIRPDGLGIPALSDAVADAHFEIGRAECRERVCQSV